jgi:sigma-B regulation protein RsbU (phosphoserine phosphatase)
MALTMSASAIHAQSNIDPGGALEALRSSLAEELATTEMFISAFYGVIDRAKGVLTYGNTGHPHAFVVTREGKAVRLPAMNPPLGMVDEPPGTASYPWRAGKDLLLLFTDGIVDMRNRVGDRVGERAVLDIVIRNRASAPDEILELVFEMLTNHRGDTLLKDDLTFVILRS